MRSKLGFSVDEWRGLPWWQARLYTEGLVEELVPPEEIVDDDGDTAVVVPLESLGVTWA